MNATVRNDAGAGGLADALADREDDVRGFRTNVPHFALKPPQVTSGKVLFSF